MTETVTELTIGEAYRVAFKLARRANYGLVEIVTGFTVGQSYRVGFKMAQRTGFGRPQTVVVRAGETAVGAFAAPTGAWEQEWTEAFTATASSLTIAFWTAPGDGYDRMGFIDDFIVKTAGPHAAVGTSNGNRYAYDANGNMTLRTEVSGTETFVYTQTWTADNRLQSVIKTDISGTVLAVTQYAYDGDGVRVRKADPSGTTLYLGLTEVTLAYTPPAGMGNTGVSADGFDLRKRGATVAWDAGVFDGQHAITQTGFAQVRVDTKYSGYRMFGLTTGDIGGGFCPTRYGLELVHGGTLEIYENCVRVAYNQAALVYEAGDQLRIEADSGVLRYKRLIGGAGTWQVLYTSTLPVTAALYFNASLYTPGSTLKEIRFVSGSTGAPSVQRTYYTFGGARVAMRDGAGAALTYLHGDHLGSASLTTNISGTVESQQRYKPYGEVRWASGSMPTDFTFTSQRAGPANYVGSLMDYVARGYSPALGRFVSADTIVPGAGNSQAYNRYMYVLGNPLGYSDPSGHLPQWVGIVVGGAILGGVINAGADLIGQVVIRNAVSTNLADAVSRTDWNQVKAAGLGGVAAGASSAALMVVGVPAAAAGGIAGLGGGQIEAFMYGNLDEIERHRLAGGEFDVDRQFRVAESAGLGNMAKMSVDAAAGAVTAGLGDKLLKLGQPTSQWRRIPTIENVLFGWFDSEKIVQASKLAGPTAGLARFATDSLIAAAKEIGIDPRVPIFSINHYLRLWKSQSEYNNENSEPSSGPR